METLELANTYQSQGWFKGMTAGQIKDEILHLQQETAQADKRTYNGKMTRTYNDCKISIGDIIIKALQEQEKTAVREKISSIMSLVEWNRLSNLHARWWALDEQEIKEYLLLKNKQYALREYLKGEGITWTGYAE